MWLGIVVKLQTMSEHERAWVTILNMLCKNWMDTGMLGWKAQKQTKKKQCCDDTVGPVPCSSVQHHDITSLASVCSVTRNVSDTEPGHAEHHPYIPCSVLFYMSFLYQFIFSTILFILIFILASKCWDTVPMVYVGIQSDIRHYMMHCNCSTLQRIHGE